MGGILRRYVLIAAAFISLVAMPMEANASTLTCGMSGSYTGEMFPTAGVCSYSGIQHIFSYIMCSFVSTINGVLGAVYCGMMRVLGELMLGILTVYVGVYGLQLVAGMAQLTVKDFVTRLIKAALITMFATSSFWGIQIAFNFFLSAIDYGVMWVLNSIPSGIGNITTNTGVIPVYLYLDDLVYQATVGPLTQANAKLVGFFVDMMAVSPPVVGLVLYWLWQNLMILAKALITFMLAVSAIAFLMALSPIFLSFMLFHTTYHFFDSWLKYMLSYVTQVIVIFAAIAMWITVTQLLINFFNVLADTVYPYQESEIVGAESKPTDSWGICPTQLVNGPNGPLPVCTNSPGSNYKAEIPLSKVPEETNFIYAIIYNLIVLLIVAYGFSALVSLAPEIGRQIAGQGHAISPALGGINRYGMISSMGSGSNNKAGGGGLGSILKGGGGSGGSGSGGGSGAGGDATSFAKQFVEQAQKQLQGLRKK